MKRCNSCFSDISDELEMCPFCGYYDGIPAESGVYLQLGTRLANRYAIGKVIGSGGFGITYLAYDEKLQQRVAIREYLPSEFATRAPGELEVSIFRGEKSEQYYQGLSKFVDEAHRLAKFQNEEGIVKTFDCINENGTAYIIMEYLEGITLAEYIREHGAIPEKESVEMLTPIMNSLMSVHEAGILHRDIAPENIFLCKDGKAKLIDFSASRFATATHSRSLTVMVKPGFSPEEQYRSRGDQGPHSDVYSVAATLYKMVTGVTPPDALERRARVENSKRDALVEPGKINKKISRVFENAVLNALNVQIEDRTATIQKFVEDLNADEPVKRVYGKIKRIDFYRWPMWVKILVPSLATAIVVFAVLYFTGVIKFTNMFSKKVVVPEGYVEVPDVMAMQVDEAKATLEEAHLICIISSNKYSDEFAANTVADQEPGYKANVKENSEVKLVISRGNGKVVAVVDGQATVPYVLYSDREEAKDILKQAGLIPVIIEDEFSDSVQKDLVMRLSLENGTEVNDNEKHPEGTYIYVHVSKGPEGFDMPNILGKSEVEAKQILQEAGLVVESINYGQSTSYEAGKVFEQSITSGTKVYRGAAVSFTVAVKSDKSNDLVTVPNVVGMEKSEARKALNDSGFAIQEAESYSDSYPSGVVISQTPAGSSSQLKGSSVSIIVSSGPKAGSITKSTDSSASATTPKPDTIPDVVGMAQSDAKKTLEAQGLSVVVKEATDEEVAAGKVVSQSPNAGTPKGTVTSVTIVVSTGKKDINVSFDSNGANIVISQMLTVHLNKPYGELPSVNRNGYGFDGWYTAAIGGNLVTSDTAVNIDSDHTLYAHWTAGKYTLTFDANGGYVSESSRQIDFDSTFGTLPSATRDYYDFAGWFTAESGGSAVSADTVVSGSVTIYAHWNEHPVSDWVLASNAPADSQIVETKWTFTSTSTTTSSSSSLPGWTRDDSKTTWGWGSTQGPVYSDPSNGSRNVWTDSYVTETITHYKYYHRYGKGKNVSTGEENVYVCGTDSSLGKGARHEIDLTSPLTYWTNNGIADKYRSYKCPSCGSSADWYLDTSTGSYTYNEYKYGTCWYYQDRVYTYYFYKETNSESTSDPSGQANVSNVQKYVKYRAK